MVNKEAIIKKVIKKLSNKIKFNSRDLSDFLDSVIQYKNDYPGGDTGEWLDNTNYFFKKPKKYPSSKFLIHFTEKDPSKVIKKWKDGVGLGSQNLGLTKHYGGGFGTLGFAFDIADAKKNIKGYQSQYGKNMILFKAKEALKVYHETDGDWQVVFDVKTAINPTTVTSLKNL